jgi:hypothetical protein
MSTWAQSHVREVEQLEAAGVRLRQLDEGASGLAGIPPVEALPLLLRLWEELAIDHADGPDGRAAKFRHLAGSSLQAAGGVLQGLLRHLQKVMIRMLQDAEDLREHLRVLVGEDFMSAGGISGFRELADGPMRGWAIGDLAALRPGHWARLLVPAGDCPLVFGRPHLVIGPVGRGWFHDSDVAALTIEWGQ